MQSPYRTKAVAQMSTFERRSEAASDGIESLCLEIDVLLTFLSYIWKKKCWLVGSGGPSIFSAVVPSFFPCVPPADTTSACQIEKDHP